MTVPPEPPVPPDAPQDLPDRQDPPAEGPSRGTVHPITLHGTPVLHEACAEVTAYDDALATLVEDMFASMAAADGVGLAANQIGVPLRVFVVDCPDASGERVVATVVNPVLELPPPGERELDDGEEGCLSVPGRYAALPRPDRCVVTGTDVRGRPVRLEGSGLLARCLQHECDHLDGTVFVDRLPARQRRRLLRGSP